MRKLRPNKDMQNFFLYFLIHEFIHSVNVCLLVTIPDPSPFVTQLGTEARVSHSWPSIVPPMNLFTVHDLAIF